MSSENNYDKFFPVVEHGVVPLGSQVLIQGKFIPKKTTGGIVLLDEMRSGESYTVQIGRIVAMGDLAFKKRDTLEPWKEGNWANIGDLVFIPRTGNVISKELDGDRYVFVLLNDVELIAKVNSLDGFAQFVY